MQNGDMVYWKKQHRGGYGYTTDFPAIVVKVNRATVRIRLGQLNLSARVTETTERNVKPASLRPRKKDCGFDNILRSNALLSGAATETPTECGVSPRPPRTGG